MRAFQSPFSKNWLFHNKTHNVRLFATASSAVTSQKLIKSTSLELQYQTGESAPFRIVRTKSNLYPVYTDYRNARSSKRTIVRKIEGDYTVCSLDSFHAILFSVVVVVFFVHVQALAQEVSTLVGGEAVVIRPGMLLLGLE
jgi:hypothetical protein